MNERINELKRQATIWCDYNIPEQFSEETGGYGGAWEDKFAELIIRECIKCGDPLITHYINTHPEQEQAWLMAAIADYSSEIEKHFGIDK